MSPAHSLLDPPKLMKNYFCQVFLNGSSSSWTLGICPHGFKAFWSMGAYLSIPRVSTISAPEARCVTEWGKTYLMYLTYSVFDFFASEFWRFWNLEEKSEICKYVKYAKYGPLWNLEEKISNTLNTGHFEILMKNSQIRKYVKYAKYGPLWNLEEKISNT